jgi:restriction endonuclease S subunit
MKRIIRLTESDLARIVRRVIKEQEETFKLRPGMVGTGYMSDTAEGKTYKVNNVKDLNNGVIEVEFINKRGQKEYGYYEPKDAYKGNKKCFRREGEGAARATNPTPGLDGLGDFGCLEF